MMKIADADSSGQEIPPPSVLAENHSVFRAIADTLPLAIYLSTGEDQVCEYVNPAFVNLFGYTLDEVPTAAQWWPLAYPDETYRKLLTEEWTEKVHGAIEGQSAGEPMESMVTCKDGSVKIIRWGYISIGEHNYTYGQDLTANKQAEQVLKESEEEFRTSMNDLLVGVVVHAPDSSILLSNLQAHKILGLSEDQITGKKAIDPVWCFTNEDLTPLKVEDYPVNRVISTGGKISNQIIGIRRPDRKELTWVLLSAVPVLTDENELKRVVINFLDITERKQAEEEKIRLQNQLYQAKKMETVGQLAGGVAHDFNNILQSILGHAELATGMLPPDAPVQGDLREIQRAARHAGDLTRQLLIFARKQESTSQVLNLNCSVQNMLKMIRPLIGENVNLDWKPGKNLWSVKMDPTHVDQILINLCVNARDAINGSNGQVSISVENVHLEAPRITSGDKILQGDYVVLSVKDTGCGMNRETKEHLFEPFFTTKEVGKGTGLGLSTVYGIAQQNRGYIDIESTPDHGTTFRIYLPRNKGKKSTPDTIASYIPADQGLETILLVEDAPDILLMSTRVLSSLGYTVLDADSPEQALHLAEEHADDIDLLLTDVIMPGMNGGQLAKTLKHRIPKLQCLFISGHAGNISETTEVKLTPMLPKPFSMTQLATRVREILDKKS